MDTTIRDMPKLHSPFVREFNEKHEYVVTPVVEEGYEWVFTDPDILAVEKLHGCLHYQVRVQTDKGKIPIGKIVNQRMPVNILSYNFENATTEYKPITYYHKEENVDGFLNINARPKQHGNVPSNMIVTPNHLFWNGNMWVRADELCVGDKVCVLSKNLDFIRKQIIMGTLLGDSSIRWTGAKQNCGFAGSHVLKQSDYFDLKMKLLGNTLTEHKGGIGGYPGSTPNRRYCSTITKNISDFIKSKCVVDDKKTITVDWANDLTPIAIAFWYMDDGSLQHDNKQCQRDRMKFATNAFTCDEVELLQNKLYDSWNISSTIQNSATTKGNVLTISADGTEILANLITPYIIPSMHYKLPVYLRGNNCYWDAYTPLPNDMLIETEILKVSRVVRGRPARGKYQYDISVADNSNYFIGGGILVHNTNVSIVIQDGVITGIWNRTTRIPFFNRGKEYIIDGVRNAYSRKYTEFLPDGQHFGECIGPRINGNPYKLDKPLWMPFARLADQYSYNSWGKYPKTFDAISEWFKELMPLFGRKHDSEFVEGVVFTCPDGRMAKLRRDMFEWFEGRRH